MTELATRNPNPFSSSIMTVEHQGLGPLLRADQSRADRMQEWLELFMKTAEVAEVLARTSFVPAGMTGKPAEVAASMMKGFELGMDPLDALANIFVVKGKVGFYAEFMRRRIIERGHEFLIVESTDSRAVVKGRRHDGDRMSEWQQASFTAEQAKKAGIDLGGYPADKLVARATSRLCRRVFPDVLSGAALVEDLQDGLVGAVEVVSDRVDEPAAAETPALQRKRQPRKAPQTSRVRPAPAAAAAPVGAAGIDEFPAGDSAEDPAVESSPDDLDSPDSPASAAQNRKMHAQFREVGLSEREDRLAVTGAILGFTLDSSASLTMSEASKVIDTIDQWVQGGVVDEQVREILNAAAINAETTTAEGGGEL